MSSSFMSSSSSKSSSCKAYNALKATEETKKEKIQPEKDVKKDEVPQISTKETIDLEPRDFYNFSNISKKSVINYQNLNIKKTAPKPKLDNLEDIL